MHVLEVIHGLSPGGAESALVRRLHHQPADIRTTVLTALDAPTPLEAELRAVGAQIVNRRLRWTDGAWMRRLVTEIKPDVIVSHSPKESLMLLTWQRKDGVPLVIIAHSAIASDGARLNSMKGAALRSLNARADLHIAVSEAAARGAQCAGARRVEIPPLGADLVRGGESLSAWPSGARFRLMTLSRLVHQKNLEALIHAVAIASHEMRAAAAHLAIVGSGPQRAQLHAAITASDLADLVSMHDHVANPSELLDNADVLVNCGTSEGGPLTLFEASLAGCRFLSTRTGVAMELAQHDRQAVLARSARPADLADALVCAIRLGALDPAERADREARSSTWTSEARAPLFYDLLRTVQR